MILNNMSVTSIGGKKEEKENDKLFFELIIKNATTKSTVKYAGELSREERDNLIKSLNLN
jgi:hypothetical protein